MKEIIITVLIGILSSSGMWAFLSSYMNNRSQKKAEEHAEVIKAIKNDLDHIKEGLEKNNKVTIAEARTTISTGCKRYRKLGYIPDDEYIAFKMIGEAYIEAKENTPVRLDFEWCMANLERLEEVE